MSMLALLRGGRVLTESEAAFMDELQRAESITGNAFFGMLLECLYLNMDEHACFWEW